MNNRLVVRTDGLVKSFSGKEVIKGCTMAVREGSIYGFLGPNGAGKTTVMKMLTGLLLPTAGTAEVLGMDVTIHRDTILRNVGSLIEVPVFFEHLSAEENLKLHLAYMDLEDIDISSALQQVGLSNTGQQPVSKFSLGMRQRLAIARAIIHKPRLLILDEPINGLDPMAIREMRQLFIELVKNQNMTIVLSSHIISEIELMADTVGIINNGIVACEMGLSDIKTQFASGLEEFFLGVVSEVSGIA